MGELFEKKLPHTREKIIYVAFFWAVHLQRSLFYCAAPSTITPL